VAFLTTVFQVVSIKQYLKLSNKYLESFEAVLPIKKTWPIKIGKAVFNTNKDGL